MSEWVLAVERAYVASATGQDVPRGGDHVARARAAVGAIASRYLAVGTPRSLSLIVDDASIATAELSVIAHRTWFQPRELRIAHVGGADATTLAEAVGGEVTSLAEALTADIVCVHAPLALRAEHLRRGTHVNVLATSTLDPELAHLATVVEEQPGLGMLAAGLVDGRQLDELTVFVAGDAAIACAALA